MDEQEDTVRWPIAEEPTSQENPNNFLQIKMEPYNEDGEGNENFAADQVQDVRVQKYFLMSYW